jgi:DNA-binding Lrp family transcriptional regulator
MFSEGRSMTEQLELEPQNTIRIETALSRFPVHKLARQRGGIIIDIKETTLTGEIKTKWEVTYNSKYGQPGPLAYKLDTLIINRRIDEARPSIPKVIKLGSLHEICRELGVSEGKSKNDVKRALRQNAFAGITAKIIYRATNGIEQTLEADFTRYSIIFTGEKFPDGRRANAVYIILNDIYMKVLNEAQTRPLDYDYLRELSPAAQRFYELIGFQIYAVLKHERPRARLSYADFCTRAPQTRYLDWEHVRKQMYKVHAPHLRSGYLASVEFQEQQTASGEPDWLMRYTPGRRAQAEFREANRKLRAIQRPSAIPRALPPTTAEPQQSARQFDTLPAPVQIGEADDAGEQLVSKLMAFHVAEVTARELVRDYRRTYAES